ncbi:VTT domain-containing protein [Acetobacteraceae bacterium]|nr:VTT domain-containing protein [Candidatus Parcubacteria bacterium]
MPLDHISTLILEYRYWILIPLSFVEGPIIAFIAGTLASLGYFNIYALAVFFLVRDVIVDLGMYAVGYWGGKRPFVQRWLTRWGITEKEMGEIKHLWNKNAWKTMFFSKLSYGVAAAFIMIAGTVQMPLKKFLSYGFLIAILHYGTLLVLGYYFGNSFGSVSGILENIQYVIGGGTLILSVYFIGKFYINKKMREAERAVEKEEAQEK